MSASRRAATLPVSFFRRSAELVARDLVGAELVSTLGGAATSGTIVETEAYLGHRDPASHGYLYRRNDRNAALYGPPGSWYVYLSYGIHWCANLVCGTEGEASAVLIRALAPTGGLEVMARRRGSPGDRQLCSGPGKLCQALAITRSVDGTDMAASGLTVLARSDAAPPLIGVTPRIGITKAADWPLRFVLAGSPWVSRGPRLRALAQ
jgi:DNA-3-methyladenine glycosylase